MNPETEKIIKVYEEPDTIELMIIEDGSAFAEKVAAADLVELPFKLPLASLGEFVQHLVGPTERFGAERPYADLSAKDGSRVHIIVSPLTRGGPVLTIRKRPTSRPSLQEIIDNGSIPAKCAEFLKFATANKQNLLIVGGTSSGKTTLLNALAALSPAQDRILVLEDTPELVLPQKHVIYLKTRMRDPRGQPDITLRDLLVNSLRMRPDRIVVGECRGAEAFDMLSAMNVGHDGVMATIHSNSAREALARLETLCLMSGVDFPLKALRQNIVQALDLIVFMTRLPNGVRTVAQVTEVTGIDQDVVTLSDLFKLTSHRDAQGTCIRLMPTGSMPRFYDLLRHQGVEPPIAFFQED
ncbi:MAG: ATPase, T2SS/T4P/T4SS family [Elusimicrobiota bacterium]|jgi:Flp pilus assembly CpaF family ATPase